MAPVSKINLKDKVDDGEMDLSMCDLQDVPVKEIATYRKVYILDLSNNHLVQLPKNFPSLTNLTKLDLSKNKLTSLPDNFGDLIKLKHLDLYKNELQHLPLSFGNLKSLKWLDLKDNPLVPAIKETAGGCLDNKQCQTCAGKMVVFYKRLVEKVEAEKELREKQRQKDRLANEMAAQKLKQQEKKSIKKKSKVKVQPDIPIHTEQPVEHKAKKEVVIKSVKSSSCISRIFLITFLMLFSIFVSLFLLTAVKCKQTEIVEQKVVQYWGVFMDSLPLPVREFGVQSGMVVRVAHDYVGSQLLHLQKNEHVIYLLDKVKAMYGEVSSRLIRN